MPSPSALASNAEHPRHRNDPNADSCRVALSLGYRFRHQATGSPSFRARLVLAYSSTASLVGRSTPRAITLYLLSRSLSWVRIVSASPPTSSANFSAASSIKSSLHAEGSAMMFQTVVLRPARRRWRHRWCRGWPGSVGRKAAARPRRRGSFGVTQLQRIELVDQKPQAEDQKKRKHKQCAYPHGVVNGVALITRGARRLVLVHANASANNCKQNGLEKQKRAPRCTLLARVRCGQTPRRS